MATTDEGGAARKKQRLTMSELRDPSQTLWCHGCKMKIDRSQFYETSIEHGKYRCKACVCRGGAKYRAAHPARDILWHLHRHEKACGLTVGDVEALLGRCTCT